MSLVANVITPLICIALITIGAKPAAAVDIRRPEVKEFIEKFGTSRKAMLCGSFAGRSPNIAERHPL